MSFLTYNPEDIPDSVVSLYEYEDDSDTTTAIDSQGSNNANITGASYSSTAKVGSLALSHDGSDDNTISQNTVDLSALGDTAGLSLSVYLYVPSTYDSGNNTYHAGWAVDTDNMLYIYNQSGNWGSLVQSSSANNSIITGPTITTDTWTHLYAELTATGEHRLYVDDIQEASNSTSHDPSVIGSANIIAGEYVNGDLEAEVIVDDLAACSDPLTDSERQTLIDRAN